jgi:hypothetical protein
MDFNKIQHISFTTAKEAVVVANFLQSLGYKIKKEYLRESFYEYELPFGNFEIALLYYGFTKFSNNEWRCSNDGELIFTYTTKAKHLIRREKLKRLNNL